MSTVALVFPHQLFNHHPVLREKPQKVLLIEDSLFFGDQQYPMRFHKQKLVYHRETMAAFANTLAGECQAEIVPWKLPSSSLASICEGLAAAGYTRIVVCEVHDFVLRQRLEQACVAAGLQLDWLATPMFLNTTEDNTHYRSTKKRWFMADFYQWQRRRLDVLMDGDKPVGGKWSFDEDNRKKLPKAALGNLPALPAIRNTAKRREAVSSVAEQFTDHPGEVNKAFYPTTHKSASRWLDEFLNERFEQFGPYEDAIVENENWLYHSVLTPMLNVGLLTPRQVLDRTLEAADSFGTPLSSVEGFVRQIIGWREFMRATYEDLGSAMRTTNHWQHTRPMPSSFYDATTGIDPIDNTIGRVIDTGYCHHIERLMVLGGFMFLCEIDPDAIYQWFMEMFIDSYDWVMVPNVYAMSQHADGGAITTKPYFSGSNYVIKMSHYKKGEWSEIWDALFWRWILNNRKELAGNHRWSMMCKNADRLTPQRVKEIHNLADAYLDSLTTAQSTLATSTK